MMFLRDLRYAARSLSRSPGLTAALLMTVAVGIGTHAAIGGFVGGLPREWFVVEGAPGVVDPEIAEKMDRVERVVSWAAALVFITAAANVAGFLLSRAWRRSHETAARMAVGATGRHLAQQVLADSLVVSLCGGALGALFGFWTARAFPALLFSQDAEQLTFATGVAPIARTVVVYSALMVVCALAPLARIRREGTFTVLRRSGGGQVTGTGALRSVLVVAQMAACAVLILGTAGLLQGFRQSLRTARAEHLGDAIIATFEASARFAQPLRGQRYFRALEHEAQRISALTSTAWISTPPGGRPVEQSVRIEAPPTTWKDVSIDTLPLPSGREMAKVKLEAGRLFGGGDSRLTCRVAIVNVPAAERYFSGDALGRAIRGGADRRIDIVGVVSYADARAAESEPIVYLFERQSSLAMPAEPVHQSFRLPIFPAVPPAMEVAVTTASRSYFAAAGAHVLAGALFPAEPAPGSCDTAVVNRETAEAYLPQGAVGGAVIDATGRRSEIVGVVDAGPLRVTQRRPVPTIFHPTYLRYLPRMTLIAGTAVANAGAIDEVERRLSAVDDGAPVRPVMTLDEYLSRTSLGPERVATALVAVSTGVALALAIVGVYAVMADSVREKRREIALRLALGAQARRIVAEVLRGGLRIASAGAIAGTVFSWLVVQVLMRAAPGFAAPALWMWLACPAVLVAIVTLAGILPARYALAIDPLTLMREE